MWMRDEEERLSGAAGIDGLEQFEKLSGPSDNHHRMAVEDEILARFANRQVGIARAEYFDRHAANVLLAIRLRRGVRKPNPGAIRSRFREQPDAEVGLEAAGYRELRVHAAGGTPLVEA